MSSTARFLVHIGLMLDQHDDETARGRRGCIQPELVRYWCCRQREEAAALIGYMA